MDFRGLSDDEIFAKVADAEASLRVDALMFMGMSRSLDKIDEAIGFYENAYELADTNGLREHRSYASRFLANALFLAKRNGEAKKVLEGEFERELTIDISDLAFGIMVGQYAMVLAEEGEIEDSIAKLEEASNMLKTDDDKLHLPMFFSKVCQILIKQNKFQMAANIGQRARSLAQETENTEELGMAMYFLGKAYEGMHMFDDSMKCYKEAFVLLDHRSDGDWELHAKLAIARLMWFAGDYDSSLSELTDLRSVARSVPWADADLPARCDLMIARNLFAKGDLEGAANKYFQARTLLRGQGITTWAAVAEVEGAVVQLAMGNFDEAVQSAEQALRWWSESSEDFTEVWVRLAYGKVMNATGNFAAAFEVLAKHPAVGLNCDFAPHLQYLVEEAHATGQIGEHSQAAFIAFDLLENHDMALNHNSRGRLQNVVAEAGFANQDLTQTLKYIGLAIKSFAAEFNSFEVARLTERLIEIADSGPNSEVVETSDFGEESVIDGL
jgi:tetratricopeptide (TPR) repeat protein